MCKDKLPDYFQEVLVGWDKPRGFPWTKDVHEATFIHHVADDVKAWYLGTMTYLLDDKDAPTHWAVLPDPPKSE